MLRGFFERNTPFIKIILADETIQSVQEPVFILDTGFTGDLQVTPKIAGELGLKITGVTKVELADGGIVSRPTANAVAAIEGANNYVQIIISNGFPLAGISFLTKFNCKATIDCKYRIVTLQKI